MKAHKTSKTKDLFPYEWFDYPDKMQNTEFHPYDVFHSKIRGCNSLEAKYTDYVNLLKNGLPAEQIVVKLKLPKPPSTGIQSYQYLQQIWKHEPINSFKDFLRRNNNEDIGPALEGMQKTIAFHHDKDFDMLKLGCNLRSLVKMCLHKSTDANFYPFAE